MASNEWSALQKFINDERVASYAAAHQPVQPTKYSLEREENPRPYITNERSETSAMRKSIDDERAAIRELIQTGF